MISDSGLSACIQEGNSYNFQYENVAHNNKFKQIRNAWHFFFESASVFTAQWFRLGGGVAHYLIWRYVFEGNW